VKSGGKSGKTAHGVQRANFLIAPLRLPTQCKDMSNNNSTLNQLLTLGGRIQCNQCQAKSKRSGVQCLGPAVKGKRVCRMHGGLSTGARTPEGRQRCAEAKTTHGRETTERREERSLGSSRVAVLESVGRLLGFIEGPRTRGRKPLRMEEAYPELQSMARVLAAKKVASRPLLINR
jgi:hypothetical protein